MHPVNTSTKAGVPRSVTASVNQPSGITDASIELPARDAMPELLDNHAAFWRVYLSDMPKLEPFPNLLPTPIDPHEPCSMHTTVHVASLSGRALRTYATGNSLTLECLQRAAWARILASYTGQRDIAFGVSVVDGLAVLRVKVSVELGDDEEMVRAVDRDGRNVEANKSGTLSEILGALEQDEEREEYRLLDTWVIQGGHEIPSDIPESDLVLTFHTDDELLSVTLRHPGTLPPAHAEILLRQYEVSLATLAHIILPAFSPPPVALQNPHPTPVPSTYLLMHQHMEYHALHNPSRIALDYLWSAMDGSDDGSTIARHIQSFTYEELNRRANRLAWRLKRTHPVQRGTIVPIILRKSPTIYVVILAILKLGMAYLPIEHAAPVDRVGFIIGDAKAEIAVTCRAYRHLLEVDGLKVVCVEDVEDDGEEEGEDLDTKNLDVEISQSDLAYVLYTSGTTGLPKGVMIEHGNVSSNLQSLTDLYPPTVPGETRVLQGAGYVFDVSVYDIFYAFSTGVTLCSAAHDLVFGDLAATIRSLRVTHLDLTSTAIALLDRDSVPTLQVLIQTGEALTQRIQDEFGRKDGVQLINAYGPTEATNVCVVNDDVRSTTPVGRIGRTLASCSASIVAFEDPLLLPLPCGYLGELCVGGLQVARGYLNRPELTAERFVEVPGLGRMYRTGDVARMLHDGQVHCYGRRDDQIKMNGVRIELAEINVALSETREIRDVLTCVRKRDGQRDVLVAFMAVGGEPARTACDGKVGLREGTGIERRVQSVARLRLSRAVVPTVYVVVTELPRGAAGKVDRRTLMKVLEELESEAATAAAASASPDDETVSEVHTWSPIEIAIQGLVADLINIPRDTITPTTSIFQLGMDSLHAIQLSARMLRSDVILSMVDIMQTPTIEGMAKLVESRSSLDPITSDPITTCDVVAAFGETYTFAVLSHLGVPAGRVAVLPCTPMQESMLGEGSGSGHYRNHFVLDLEDGVDVLALRRAWETVVNHVDMLRTGFLPVVDLDMESVPGDELFAQVVWDKIDIDWTVEPCADFNELTMLAFASKRHPDPLTCLPPHSFTLLISPTATRLLVCIHHAIYDARSLSVIFAHVHRAYLGQVLLPNPPFSWALRRILERSRETDHAKAFWKKEMRGAETTPFPDVSGTTAKTGRRGTLERVFKLPAERLELLCRDLKATVQVVGMAAWAKLLSSYTGNLDTIFGVVFSGRSESSEWDSVVGPCLNTVPCRIRAPDAHDERTNMQWLEGLQMEYAEWVAYQQTPLRKIRQWCDCAFDTIFMYDRPEAVDESSPFSLNYGYGTLESALAVELLRKSDGTFTFEVMYNHDLVSYEQAVILAKQYEAILYGIIENPSGPTVNFHLPLNLESVVLPSQETSPCDMQHLHGWVEHHAREFPTRIALEFAVDVDLTQGLLGRETLSYAELNARANRLAHYLLDRGVTVEQLVPVCIPRSPLFYIAMLAISKAGACYVPLDPEAPVQRRLFMLEDTRATMVLAVGEAAEALEASGVEVLLLDDIHHVVDRQSDLDPCTPSSTDDLCYVLYTSGTSQGRPKGVEITHRNVVQSIANFYHEIPFTESSRFLQAASPAFDVSLFETHLAWCAGVRLCTAPKPVLLQDLELAIRSFGITHADLTPTVSALIRHVNVPTLEVLVTGGEALTVREIEEFAGRDDLLLFNAYGPTETTIGCTMHSRVQKTARPTNVGRGLGDTILYVMSPDIRPLPRGSIGELVIGGGLVGRGYLNQPALTAEKFITWTSPAGVTQRLYRTGDLVRLIADDTVEFCGREDSQVKIKGVRIELEEISECLKGAKFVTAAVTVHERLEDDETKRLLSFVVFEGMDDITGPNKVLQRTRAVDDLIDTVRRTVKAVVPTYMMPRDIVPINRIPIGSTGKMDVPTLKHLHADWLLALPRRDSGVLAEWEKTQREELIAATIAEVARVSVSEIGSSTTLFELGIDSLGAILVSSRLRKKGIEISVASLLRNPTVGDMAELMRSASEDVDDPAVRGREATRLFRLEYLTRVINHLGVPLKTVQDVYPCLPLQEGMLVQTLQSTAGVYVNQFKLELSPEVDLGVLKASWLKIVAANDTLRTGFVPIDDGEHFAQVVYETFPGPLWGKESFTTESQRLEAAEQSRVDVIAAVKSGRPPIRVRVFRLGLSVQSVVTLHHAVYDGWSLELLLTDVQRAYHGKIVTGRPPYSAFIDHLVGSDTDGSEAHWKQVLMDFTATPFPELTGIDYSDRAPSDHWSELSASVPCEALETFCRKSGVTSVAAGQLAWAKVLGQYLGEEDVVFGHNVSGRTASVDGIEAMMGPCFNTLPCRVRIDPAATNLEQLRRMQKDIVDVLPYQHTSLRNIQRLVAGRSERGLFDTLFLLQKQQENEIEEDSSIWQEVLTMSALDYPLSIEMEVGTAGPITFRAGCKGSILGSHHLNILMRQLDAALCDIMSHPDSFTKDIPFAAMSNEIIAVSNNPPTLFNLYELLHQPFEANAATRPSAVALEWATDIAMEGADVQSYTFFTINNRANQIAHRLLEIGATGNVPVSIDKSPLMYMCILGVLKAGLAYVPIDPELPDQRKAYMAQDSGAVVVCTNEKYRIIFESDVVSVLILDDETALDGYSTTNPTVSAKPTDLAYVLFTSGTTGNPKAVMVEHLSVVQCVQAFVDTIPFDTTSRSLQFATCSFDVAICETFCAWSIGFPICSAPKDVILRNFVAAAVALRITHISLTPSVAALLKREYMPFLRVLITGGEALTHRVLVEWAGREDVLLFNAYGPTEATIGCVMHSRVQKDTKTTNIGHPLPSCSAFVVDSSDRARIVLCGAVGELVIGGPHVARGYLNRDALTAENFYELNVGDGWMSRVYATGDLASILPDGSIEFLGRVDEQIKLNGIRIELGEINAVVGGAHPSIQEAITILTRHRDQQRDRLVTFLSMETMLPDFGGKKSPEKDAQIISLASLQSRSGLELFHAVKEASTKLPTYMTPGYLFAINHMPFGKTGKIDRKELARLYGALDSDILRMGESRSETAVERPWAESELRIRTFLAEIAKVDESVISRSSSIFQLGLDSISAIRLSAKLETAGLTLGVSEIMRNPTIEGMCALMRSESDEMTRDTASTSFVSAEYQHELAAFSVSVLEALPVGCDRENVASVYPCTPMQEGMLLESIRSNGERYFNHMVFEVGSTVDVERLREAWETVVSANDILRTRFYATTKKSGSYAQIVQSTTAVPWTVTSISDSSNMSDHVQTAIRNAIEFNRELATTPVCLTLIQSPDAKKLVLSMHHALYDGWSLPLLLQDVAHVYRTGETFSRPAYRELAEYILSRPTEESKAYWSGVLRECVPSVFPEDLSPEVLHDTQVAVKKTVIVSELTIESMDEACKYMGVTLQAVGQAAWGKLLASYTGTSEVVFGHIVSGRTVPVKDAENIMGPALNTIPCRVTISKHQSNLQLTRSLHASNIAAIPFHHTPLRNIHKWVKDVLVEGRPLFDTLFVFQRLGDEEAKIADAEDELWKIEDGKAEVEYAISIEIQQQAGELRINGASSKGILSQKQLDLLLSQLKTLMLEILLHPEASAASSGFTLPTSELSISNPLPRALDVTGLQFLHSGVERFAKERGDQVALEFVTSLDPPLDPKVSHVSLSYEELNRVANRAANKLVRSGVKPGDIVPVCVEKSQWLYVAILAVLKAGAAYVPCDPNLPLERQRFMIADVKSKHVVGTTRQTAIREALPNISFVTIDEDLQHESDDNLEIEPKGLCYLLFTSGTEGVPKGCEITHSNVAQALASFRQIMPLTPASRFLAFAEFTFDVSVFEIFLTWSVGATLVSATKDLLLTDIENAVRTLNITHADLTPTVAALLNRGNVPSLEVLVTGGELLSQRVLDDWAPSGSLWNAFGPTEATIGCTALARVTVNARLSNVGQVLRSCSAYILSDSNAVLPRGAVGELCVGGHQVARGYFARPELTSEKFVELPHIGERIYRTGDFARMLMDGTVMFMGRRDDQIKMNGLRIELSEIAACVAGGHDEIQDAAAFVLRHPAQERGQIVAFVAARTAQETGIIPNDKAAAARSDQTKAIARCVMNAARRRLPGYMVPSALIFVGRLPRSGTEKIDKRALQHLYNSLDVKDLRLHGEDELDKDDEWTLAERTIQDVLIQVSKLSADDVGRTISIFHLGLDSISSIAVSAGLRARGIHLTVADILQNPTVQRMARRLTEKTFADKSARTGHPSAHDAVLRALGSNAIWLDVDTRLGYRSEDVAQILPATPGQIFTMSSWLSLDKKDFVATFPFILRQRVDRVKLEKAWELVVQRNSILRTAFLTTTSPSMPLLQVVLKEGPSSWTTTTLDRPVDEATVRTLVAQEQAVPLDMRRPPVRVVAASFQDKTVLLFTLLHTLYDGWSMPLLRNELEAAYESVLSDATMPPVVEFADFVQIVQDQDTEALHRPYWTEYIAEAKPTMFPRASISSNLSAPKRTEVLIDDALTNAESLQLACKSLGVTLHAVFLAAWGRVAARATGIASPTFGFYHSGRTIDLEGIDALLAPCINLLPIIATNAGSTDSIIDVARKIQETLGGHNAVAQVPLYKINEWAGGMDRPLHNTNVNFLRFPDNIKLDSSDLFEGIQSNVSSLVTPIPSISNADALDPLDPIGHFPPTSSVRIELDIDIVVRGSAVAVGIFCDGSFMDKKRATSLIGELCGIVGNVLPAPGRTVTTQSQACQCATDTEEGCAAWGCCIQ
ncbi:hypothetical protein HKX48_006308 [Thoreauomyces humboldtii]|nr:hypothetical protein HKX48_006308 [Thoreauomyces humboldtii]